MQHYDTRIPAPAPAGSQGEQEPYGKVDPDLCVAPEPACRPASRWARTWRCSTRRSTIKEEAEIKVLPGEAPDALTNVEIGTFLFKDLNRRQGAHAQGLVFTYSFENAIGRSSDEALGAARQRVAALCGQAAKANAEDADNAAAGSGAEPAQDSITTLIGVRTVAVRFGTGRVGCYQIHGPHLRGREHAAAARSRSCARSRFARRRP